MKAGNICLLFLITQTFNNLIFAQAPPIQWDKNFGGSNYEDFNIVIQTTDGGYISAGWSQSPVSGVKSQPNWDVSNSTPDYWIIKTDANGIKQWDRRFGGTGWETCGSLQQTSDGGYILGGYSSSPVSGDKSQPSKGAIDYWIIKLNSSGIKQWDKTFGGTSNDYLTRVIQTSDDGYLLCGFSQSGIGGDKSQTSRGAEDYWIIKTDANGNKQWDKTFGGSLDDYAYSIIQTDDGGYLVGGTSSSGLSGDHSQPNRGPLNTMDYWVVKTDASGNKLWDKRFGTSDDDLCVVALQTPDGGYIMGGYSTGTINGDRTVNSRGSYDYWLVKIDAAGNKLWDKRYGGSDIDYLFSMQITTDGGFILGGTTYSGIGGDKTQTSRGNEDYWIIKTDGSGNLQWDKTMGGNGSDWLNYISQTSDGYYICGGQSYSDVSGEKSQPVVGSSDYWVIKLGLTPLPLQIISFDGKYYNSKAHLTWTLGSGFNCDHFKVERSKDAEHFYSIGEVKVSGAFYYKFTDSKPLKGLNYYRLKQGDLNNAFSYSKIISINTDSKEVWNIEVYPNPVQQFLNVKFKQGNVFDLIVADAMGTKIFESKNFSCDTKIDCSNFPDGIYFIYVNNSETAFTAKFLKQQR